ncbi:MAG: T9SS type A sorting domain-containing protein [Bacteroidetes bacterium]|nr:T9SS type A sorting domain-containing protein [Bacteroidota bacterium]
MKIFSHVIVAIICCFKLSGQGFINGDFENNETDTCVFNLTNSSFNSTVENVYSFGIEEQPDVQTDTCYVTPQSGDWCIGLSARPSGGHDAIALELTSSLVPDQFYELKFWTFGNTSFHPLLDSLKIGLSSQNSAFGNRIYTTLAEQSAWQEHTILFQSDSAYSFITVEMKEDFNSGWVQIDNFSISNSTGGFADLNSYNHLQIFPNPASEVVNFKVESNTKIAQFSIFTTSGKIAFEGLITNSDGFKIDIGNLPNGVYVVKVSTDSNQFISRFIKI